MKKLFMLLMLFVSTLAFAQDVFYLKAETFEVGKKNIYDNVVWDKSSYKYCDILIKLDAYLQYLQYI